MTRPARLLDGMPYVHSRDMGPDYLAKKFRRIQRELEQKKQQAAQPVVTPIAAHRKVKGA